MHGILRRNHALKNDLKRLFSSHRRFNQDVRPSTAPKQTPDVKSIRNQLERYSENAVLRNYEQHRDSPYRIAALVAQNTAISKDLVEPRKKLNQLEEKLASAHRQNDITKVESTRASIEQIKPQIDKYVEAQNKCVAEAQQLALSMPNLTSEQTPKGDEFKILRYVNYDPQKPPTYEKGVDHSAIGQRLGILDFSSASTAMGWGFYYLLNEAALLEQALVQYALAVAMRYGWKVVTPPSLVYSHIADSCGFQPRDSNDEQQIWQVAQAEKDQGKPKRSLAATAEIPLAAMQADKVILEGILPIKVIGSSRCYRAEAGARGVDTKGLYRVHEFTKVEMFAWTNCPSGLVSENSEDDWTNASNKIFEEMVEIQTQILSSLGLPCRVLEMPTSDMGASAFRKIDIEALFPSRMNRDNGWGELTSVSNCTDYQSRRLNTRIKEPSGTQKKFAHTLNGTALAVPRVLACILENGWREQHQAVLIPEVLRPYMNGQEMIGP